MGLGVAGLLLGTLLILVLGTTAAGVAPLRAALVLGACMGVTALRHRPSASLRAAAWGIAGAAIAALGFWALIVVEMRTARPLDGLGPLLGWAVAVAIASLLVAGSGAWLRRRWFS